MPRSSPQSPEQVVKRYEQLKHETERANAESLWQSASNLILPVEDFQNQTTPGQQRRNKMYDPTATQAAVNLGSTIHSLAMNPATEWFNLAARDPAPELDDPGFAWLQGRSADLLNHYNSAASGFNLTAAQFILSAAVFGTGPFVRDPLSPGRLPRYFSIPLSTFVFDVDDGGDMVESYRTVCYNVHDLARDFGAENLSKKSKALLDKGDHTTRVQVVHGVFRNDRAFPAGGSPFRKPWVSVYAEKDARHGLREGGFDRNPYHVFRWRVNAGEKYGRGPGIDLLPQVKLINVMTRDALIAGEQAVRPPMMIPAQCGVEGGIRLSPGSINYYQNGTRDRPEPMVTGANPDNARSLIEDAKRNIEAGFFNDLLKLPDNDRMTATEIITRQNQRAQVLSPVHWRLSSVLNDLIGADYDLMRRLDMFPPEPPSLRDRGLTVDYRSPLAIAQQASQANNFLQFVNVTAPLVQADPALMQEIDGSGTFRALARATNAAVVKFKDADDVAAQRAAEQQALARQQQAETAATLAGAGKDAADAASTVNQTNQLTLTS